MEVLRPNMKKLLLAISVCTAVTCGCESTPKPSSVASNVENIKTYNLTDCKVYNERGQYNEAIKACENTLSQGISESAIYLGDIYLFGRGDQQIDVNKALSYYEMEGGVKGLYKAARVYEKGINTDINLSKALSYYEKAANQGDILSANYVANSYLKGRAVGKDPQKAIHYLTIAADAGDAKSQYQLAKFYEEGKIVPEDDELAYIYFSKAAAQKNIDALYEKAVMEENGIGTEKNISKAIETYRELVMRSNYTQALFSLGKLLITTSSNHDDHTDGIGYLEQASKKQFLPAKLYLAIQYYKGEVVDQNTSKGLDLLKECISRGYPPAMYALAQVYENGTGVVKNDASAYAWYRLAFDCGIHKAENMYKTAYSNATLRGIVKLADNKYVEYSQLYKCVKNYDPRILQDLL